MWNNTAVLGNSGTYNLNNIIVEFTIFILSINHNNEHRIKKKNIIGFLI